MCIWVIIIAIIIGAIWGALTSKDGEKSEGAFAGAVTGGMGCGYVLIQIFIFGIGIMILFWLFRALFG